MNETLEHLLNGGTIYNKTEDSKWILDHLVLSNGNEEEDVTVDEIEELFEIYKSEEMIEIERLQDIISRQNEEIQKLSNTVEPRGYRYLLKSEVKDIEQLIISGARTRDIVKEYKVSQSVISRIRLGNHQYSSNPKQHLKDV